MTYVMPKRCRFSCKINVTEITNDDCSAKAFGKLQLSRMSHSMSRNFTILFDGNCFEIREMVEEWITLSMIRAGCSKLHVLQDGHT